MKYNELKEAILKILNNGKWQFSKDILTHIRSLNWKLNLPALRMALMRYYRQGILERRRRSGAYEYRISDRGLERLAWLTKTEGEPARS